jgi:hypothetical protein
LVSIKGRGKEEEREGRGFHESPFFFLFSDNRATKKSKAFSIPKIFSSSETALIRN